MATRIGVDIGGTFTDLVYYDEQTGQTVEGKVPTTPAAPEQGVINAIREHVPADILTDAAYFLHGTTVGLNALLERRGAKVGLLCTEGMRDVLEIRRGDRAEMYNPLWLQPEPLVPRHLRRGIGERMKADGTVYRPLDPATVAAALDYFRQQEVDAIAVALMNAYANPAHELEIEKLVRASGFAGGISLSHRISGEYREYERTSTTVIDAFVRGRMADYLRRLEGELRQLGFSGQCLITRSGSGSMTFDEAEARPFETIMSGPVAGAQGASELAKTLGIEALITADVGGTSFDTALVVNGEPTILYEGSVDGMPVQIPWVDVRSIGSGGGSIAAVDAGGLMRVGPRSAGAVPGPAAYGKGGTEATMTDAAVVLGMLGPGKLAGGISLDFERADAVVSEVAARLGKSPQETAVGVMRIAASSMANAMREVTVEQGIDPRGLTLLPFGGAGPLMAVLLANELSINRIVVPPLAGNFSAWGLLGADMIQSAARTSIHRLDADGIDMIDQLLGQLFAELDQRATNVSDLPEERARLDLRYAGQEHWLSIDIPVSDRKVKAGIDAITDTFETDYRRTFGGLIRQPIEIVSVRATRIIALPRRSDNFRSSGTALHTNTECPSYSFRAGRMARFRVVPREAVTAPLVGPAIITENSSTLYLDAGWTAETGARSELVLTRAEH
jgi:N-methylhydantoinase A